ncbi:hypothetical protein CF328_g1191 [Tilletia controversa]|nr:hypothetical protein CF328_g1191 [Tilletia controversa]
MDCTSIKGKGWKEQRQLLAIGRSSRWRARSQRNRNGSQPRVQHLVICQKSFSRYRLRLWADVNHRALLQQPAGPIFSNTAAAAAATSRTRESTAEHIVTKHAFVFFPSPCFLLLLLFSSTSSSSSSDSARAESKEAQTLASELKISAASAATAAENKRSPTTSSPSQPPSASRQQRKRAKLAAAKATVSAVNSDIIEAENVQNSIDEHSAVLSSLLVSSLLMGCSSLLCAVSALVRLPATFPDSWHDAWQSFWTYYFSIFFGTSATSSSADGGDDYAQHGQHVLWEGGHTDMSLHAFLAENSLVLFTLLTLFVIVCALIAQSGLRLRRPSHTTIPFNANGQHASTQSAEKTRFDAARGRSAFSLRSGLESPHTSRPQSRTQSPSSSVTSAEERSSRIHRLAAGLAGSAPIKQRNRIISGGTSEGQQHSNQSLSFADRIAVKFRTLPRTDSDGDSHEASGNKPAANGISRHTTHTKQAPTHQQQQKQQKHPHLPEAAATSPGKVFLPYQLFDPTTDEERALRKVYDDILLTRTAESDLNDQLAAHSTHASSSRAALEASLEALRTRRKADDAERASLRARVKVLDEERRVAEGKRREAERRLDGWKAKMGALEREWEEGVRALSSAKDLRKSLRDEWKRREEEIGKRKVEVEREVEELQRVWEANESGGRNSVGKGAKDKDGPTTAPGTANAATTGSPAPSSATETKSPANRDHNNAKVVRDRIKTLEGQVKKERERLERIKRSAQAATSSAGSKAVADHHAHEVGGKGRHAFGGAHHQLYGRHSGSIRGGGGGGISPGAITNPTINTAVSPSHNSGTLAYPSSSIASSPIAAMSPSTQAHTGSIQAGSPPIFNFDPALTHPFGNSNPLPPFLPPSSHMLGSAFGDPHPGPTLRPLGPFDSLYTSPIHRHADTGSASIRAGDGLLPMHMNYAGAGGGPTGSAALNEGSHQHHPELHLSNWVRSSVLGTDGERAPFGISGNGLELPSFVPRSNSGGIVSKNGSAVLSGSPLAGKSGMATQHSLPHLPWDWPAFRSVAPVGTAGNGVGVGLGSSDGTTTTSPNGGSRFGSQDGLVLPLHTRTNLAIPAAPGTMGMNLSSPLSSAQNAFSLPNALPPSIAVTPINNMDTGHHSPLSGSSSIFNLTPPSSASLTPSHKARPRTNANRRRARSPVSPYSAGLLPRNLLSYADDDDEDETALNEMESAWASLEEEVDDEEG